MQRKRIRLTQGQRGWLIGFCVWVMLFTAHCQCGRAGRACETDNDCKGSGANQFCLQGVCSAQQCEVGAKESCYTGTPIETAKQAPCQAGERACGQNGRWGACLGEVTPSREICDGVDNDCDGQIDNKATYVDPDGKEQSDDCQCLNKGASRSCYSGPSAAAGRGGCRRGVQFCDDNNRWSRCLEQQLPQPEICDSNDNDCDGKVDEGGICPPCTAGETRTCYTGPIFLRGVGNCKEGVQICKEGAWPEECLLSIAPSQESCLPNGQGNDQDEDCDGKTDEGCACEVGGACKDVQLKCCGGVCLEPVLKGRDPACPCSPSELSGACGNGLACCAGACVDTRTNALHCGACGTSCSDGTGGCRGTQCTQDCKESKRICKDPEGKEVCVEKVDPLHCGGCNCRCKPSDLCVAAEGGAVCQDRKGRTYPCEPENEREDPKEPSPEQVPEEVAQESSEPTQDAGAEVLPEPPPQEMIADGSMPEPKPEPTPEPKPEPTPEPKPESTPEVIVMPESGPDPEPTVPDNEFLPEPEPEPEPVVPDNEFLPEPEPEPEPVVPDNEFLPEPEPEPEPMVPDDEFLPEPEPEPEPMVPDDEFLPEPEPEFPSRCLQTSFFRKHRGHRIRYLRMVSVLVASSRSVVAFSHKHRKISHRGEEPCRRVQTARSLRVFREIVRLCCVGSDGSGGRVGFGRLVWLPHKHRSKVPIMGGNSHDSSRLGNEVRAEVAYSGGRGYAERG